MSIGDLVASYLDPLINFVSAHPWLAYLTVFLAALLEAVPVVGSVIPGSTIILALSALVPGGELWLEGVLAAAVAGAVLGDGTAFWVGHRAQREILNTWPLANYPRLVAQSETFFQRWGTWAVFFARFVPPIRAFVPLTAGALGMPPPRFCVKSRSGAHRCANCIATVSRPSVYGSTAVLDGSCDRVIRS